MAWRAVGKSPLFDFRNRYEFIPIIACVGTVCIAAGATIIYSMFKMDVTINKRAPPGHEEIDLMQPQSKKFITLNQKYMPMPELHQLLKEIKEEEKKMEKQ